MARIGELIGPNSEVMHPKTSASVVYLEDGRSVEQVLSDDIDYGNVVFQDNSYKFDSDVEDDFAKTVVIKGQTYQNILPEPSTHVLTNNKEMFKVNEGLDPNVEIVDGVSKNAILSGNTLVNLTTSNDYTLNKHNNIVSGTTISVDLKTPKEIKYTVLEEYTDWVYFHIAINLSMLKPNTKYIVMTDMAENIHYARICRGDGQDALDQSYGSFNGGKTATLTTNNLSNNTSTGIKLYLRVKTGLSVGDVVHVKNVRLIEYQEGMENWSIPHFEGIASCEMPVLQTVGSNLIKSILSSSWDSDIFNYEEIPNGYILDNNINRISYCRNLENLIVGKQYTFSCNIEFLQESSKNEVQVYFKGKNDGKYGPSRLTNGELTWTFTYDKKYESFGIYFKIDGNVEHLRANITNARINSGGTALVYEPYKVNILSIPEEVVLRSLPNGVKDTLNLNTGEYVQRIGEIVLDGSENYWYFREINENTIRVTNDNLFNSSTRFGINDKLYQCNQEYQGSNDVECLCIRNDKTGVGVRVSKQKLSSLDSNGFRQWLSQNPITVQYELATPIIKTVDVSSSGNWEKVVLNGSENWTTTNDAQNQNSTMFFRLVVPNILPTNVTSEKGNLWSDTFVTTPSGLATGTWGLDTEAISVNTLKALDIRILKSKLPTQDVAGFKTWLSENPVTVWYQTATHQDSTQVKQPIFFKDGHIIQSSGADHSLIPILDYQAKTRNSYVMDLMKTNTRYTMKAKSASGTFTIDGTSYGAGTNGTFTTPSSMTNKFLVMSNKTNEEVMILEGDVVSKTITYFKGIKSAFEDESQIEVLSQGKNLFDVNEVQTNDRTRGAWETRIEGNKIYSMRVTSQVSGGEFGAFIQIPVKPSVEYVYKFDFTSTDPNLEDPQVYIYNNSSIWGELLSSNSGKTTKFTTKANTQFITIGLNYRSGVQKGTEFCTYNAILIETTQTRDYEPYKSNSTKIPLLSPLRSLPNGVCDELIIDRMKKKVTLIQRVEAIPATSVDDIRLQANLGRYNRFFIHKRQTTHPTFSLSSIGSQLSNWCPHHAGFTTDSYHFYVDGAGDIMLFDKSETLNSIRTKMSQSPFVALHQLATPIVTEIDLEGFPYIYKDGHIFLNSEIAPTVGVEYSLNQGQRIASQVETLQRHEKQFSKLEQYFADLVYSDYNFALLRFSEKLRQQEGDI